MEVEQDPAFADFRNVLFYVWKKLGLPDPTPVQYDIAHFLQHGPRRQLIEGFRGVGKSWEASAYVCDALRKDPTLNILVVSASKARADDFSTFTLRLINEIDIFEHLRPRDGQRNSKISFDVGPAPAAHAPSVKSVGLFGQITGSRADIVIADDVEVSNNSATQLMRDKLQEVIKEFDAVLKPGGRVHYLGTPQTEQSIYNLLGTRGYTKRIWPARYPTPVQALMYGSDLAPMIREHLELNPALAGQPADPARFGEFDLQEREASYGRSGFALQFMLDTRLSDAERYPLKLSDLVVMDLHADVAPERVVWARDPDLERKELPNVGFNGDRYYRPLELVGKHIPYTGSVMAIDPAGRGSNETAFAIVKMLNGQLFVPELSGLAGGYGPEVLDTLAERAKLHKVNKIIIEANFGDGMFSELLKPALARIYPCAVEEVKHSIQKEKRIIDVLEPVMNQHRLIVDAKVIEDDHRRTADLPEETALKYQLFYQMSRITRDRGALRFDDRIDVLSIGVAYWVEQMGREIGQAMSDHRSKQIDKGLREFMAAFHKQKRPMLPSWMAGNRARRA